MRVLLLLLAPVFALAAEVVFANIRTSLQAVTIHYSASEECLTPESKQCSGPFTLEFGETHRVQSFSATRIYFIVGDGAVYTQASTYVIVV